MWESVLILAGLLGVCVAVRWGVGKVERVLGERKS